MRRLRLPAAISAGLALAAGAVLPLPASAEAPRGTATAPPASGGVATVRLITGDRVALTRGPDGRQAASVTPGPGRKGLLFRTLEQDGRVTVLPSDGDPLVAAGRLDRGLFDVTVPLDIDDSGRLSDDGPHPPDALSPTDRRLLSLLVAGVSDKTIASQMQLSRRTVQRRIQSLMERSDAATRMQLAWHAARHGWL
ncbi:response regulator transcription factor [Streptomyces globisporus]